MFIAALFTIAKTQKQPKYPVIDEWIKKIWGVHILYMCVYVYIYIYTYYNMYIYIYIHIYNITQLQKKNEIMPLAATWMNLEIIILSEINQTEKYKYHMISLICGI